MTFYVYVLLSQTKRRTYVGSTFNVEERLKQHNFGKVKSSKPYAPYTLIYKEEFLTLKEARQKETFFKSTSGRRKIKQLIENYSK